MENVEESTEHSEVHSTHIPYLYGKTSVKLISLGVRLIQRKPIPKSIHSFGVVSVSW